MISPTFNQQALPAYKVSLVRGRERGWGSMKFSLPRVRAISKETVTQQLPVKDVSHVGVSGRVRYENGPQGG